MTTGTSVLAPVAEHLWQTTFCVILAWSLTRLLLKNSAAVRHWIWFFASLKFLVPFSLLIGIGDGLQPVVPAVVPEAPLATIVRAGSSVASLPDLPLPVSSSRLPGVLAALWLLGAAVFAGLWLRSGRQARVVVRAATPVRSRLPIQVRISQARLAPTLVGIIRPVLLLPAGIRERLPPAQLRAVLIHELAHLRRRDNLLALVHMAVEILFWFHPFVWWIGRRLMDERERACDEAVLGKLRKPRVYAEGILAICRIYKEAPLTHVSGITHSNLQKRIRDILSRQTVARMSLAKRGLLAAAAMGVVGSPVLLGLVRLQPVAAITAVPFQTEPAVMSETGIPVEAEAEILPGIPAEPVPRAPHAGLEAAVAETVPRQPLVGNLPNLEPLSAPTAAQETAPVPPTLSESAYVLGIGDEIEISVWREPELSRRVIVRPDGKISLPLVNDIQAAGLTPMQLRSAITPILGLRIEDPVVTVMVASVRSLSVSITGSVQRPGEYVMSAPITIVELIARAGGFREFAQLRNIVVVRRKNGVDTRYRFDYDAYLQGSSAGSNILLAGSDIVIVP